MLDEVLIINWEIIGRNRELKPLGNGVRDIWDFLFKAILCNSLVRAAFTCLKSGHKLPKDTQLAGFVSH